MEVKGEGSSEGWGALFGLGNEAEAPKAWRSAAWLSEQEQF